MGTPRIDRIDGNYAINGRMDYWQRGTTLTAASGYICDRMFGARSTGTATTYQQSTIVPNDQCRFSFRVTATTATNPRMEHRVESIFARSLANETVTVQVKVYCLDATATPINIAVSYPTVTDDYASTVEIINQEIYASPTQNTWLTCKTVFTAPAQAVNGLRVNVMRASGAAVSTDTLFCELIIRRGDFSNTEMEYSYAGGDVIGEIDYILRYFEKTYTLNVNPGTVTPSGSMYGSLTLNTNANSCAGHYFYKEVKRTTPLVTIYAPKTGTASRCSIDSNSTDYQVSVNHTNQFSFSWFNNESIAAGQYVSIHATMDAEI